MNATKVKKALVSDRCINSICKLLHARVGIVISEHQIKHLTDYVQEVLQGEKYSTDEEYAAYLGAHSERDEVFERLISAVTVGESYFFRYASQMQFLKQVWLPKILRVKKERNDRSLRIWSAGCSAGQEIYSIAVLLREGIVDIDQWHISLIGTDINPDVLARAIKGAYHESSLRTTAEHIKNKYFIKQSHGYQLVPAICDMVGFAYHNLVYDKVPAILSPYFGVDLILCRNVFIYFSPEVVANVVKIFENCLMSDGTLLLGAADFLPEGATNLITRQDNDITYYLKQEPVVVPPKRIVEKQIVKTATSDQTAEIAKEYRQQLNGFMQQGLWRDSLALIEELLAQEKEKAWLLQHKAHVLASLGDLQQALASSEKSIQLDALNAQGYFVKGLILINLNQLSLAEQAIRRALFLDKEFVEAYYYLGFLLLRQHQMAKGIKNLQMALRKAQEKPRDQKMHLTGVTFAEFMVTLKREIEIRVKEIKEDWRE
jgi:chemotaxis protein methyltransferase CheR